LAAPQRNLEIKARDSDPRRTLELALKAGAEDHGEIAQRDTYFGHANGRLKLREQTPGETELIQYRRPDEQGPRTSEFRRVPTPDADALREALDAALGTLVTVEKSRRLLLWHGIRIHLDEVEGLGSFLELEAPDEGEALEELRANLGIADEDLIAGSYSDLLLATPEALLAAAGRAMQNAYAPFSEFKVGAALRTPTGGVYTGANVENAAYPQGQCAEASAIGALIAAGLKNITEAAVISDGEEFCVPCGGCRQRLREFIVPGAEIHLCALNGARQTTTLEALLPRSFGPEFLPR
jgi:homotetrameric cytidine deaminase